MSRLLSLLFAFLLAISPALADGPYGGYFPDPSNSGDPDATYLTLTNSGILTSERILTVDSTYFTPVDNGANGTYTITLKTLPITIGGTGATTAQGGFNALAAGTTGGALATGNLLYYNGTNWARLAAPSAGQFLGESAGSPVWTTPPSGAPADAEYVVMALHGSLSAERVLQGTSNRVSVSSGAGTVTLDIGSDVVTLTGSQTLTGKTLTSPRIDTSLIFELGANDVTVTAATPGAARAYAIPNVGADCDFMMTSGAQTKAGVLTLSSAPVLSTGTVTVGGNTVTFPSAVGTIVYNDNSATLSNKELGSGTSFSNAGSFVLNQSGGDYTISWANPGGNLAYSIPNVATNCDFAMMATGATYANGGVAYGNGNVLNVTAAGTSGRPLVSAGAGAPSFAVLGIAGGGTNNASLSVTQGVVYYGDGSKLIGLATGTDGQVLTTHGVGANPTWETPAAGSSGFTVSAESSNFTADTAGVFHRVDTSSGTVTATLDSAVTEGSVIKIQKSAGSSNALTITANGGQTISNCGSTGDITVSGTNRGVIELIRVSGGWEVT